MNIAVDFDGVIHRYSEGWKDGTIYDPPIEGCKEALRRLMADGHRIIVYSAREDRVGMESWMARHQIPYSSIFSESKPKAHVYLDDRGLRFHNWPQSEKAISVL